MQLQKIKDNYYLTPQTKEEVEALSQTLGHQCGRFPSCLNEQEKDNFISELTQKEKTK